MKRKVCVTTRWIESGLRFYDNFSYSEEHRGWLCRQCHTKLQKEGGTSECPEILRRP
jgi:hypothetical protein